MSEADLIVRIRRRAYQMWEREGRPVGRELSHWLQAEMELSGEFTTEALKSSQTTKRPKGNTAPKTTRQTAPPTKRRPISR
jgi:hypothetical protein